MISGPEGACAYYDRLDSVTESELGQRTGCRYLDCDLLISVCATIVTPDTEPSLIIRRSGYDKNGGSQGRNSRICPALRAADVNHTTETKELLQGYLDTLDGRLPVGDISGQ